MSPALGIDRDPDRGILLIKYHDGHRQLDALGFKMLGQDIGVARTTGANGKDTAVFYRSILNEQGDHPVALHFLGVIEFQHGGSMIFWDASAIVPLLVIETQTRQLQSIAAKDSAMPVWWGSEVECNSAVARRDHDGAPNVRAMTLALRRLQQLTDAWHEIDPSDAIPETAIRFLRVHPLRTADALQLAAAFVATERRPPSLEMVTLDDRLANAARREGFAIVDLTPID